MSGSQEAGEADLRQQVGEEPQCSSQSDPRDSSYECAHGNDDGDEYEEGHAQVDDCQLHGLRGKGEQAEQDDNHDQETGGEEQPGTAGPVILPGVEELLLESLSIARFQGGKDSLIVDPVHAILAQVEAIELLYSAGLLNGPISTSWEATWARRSARIWQSGIPDPATVQAFWAIWLGVSCLAWDS